MTATRVSRDDGYGRSSRFYEVKGKQLVSVTTVLSAIGKPALIGWAAKTERELVLRAACDLWEDVPVSTKMSRLAFETTLSDRIGKTKAYTREMAKASDIGTECHRLIEWNLRRELQQRVGPQPQISEKALWAFMAYEDWRKAANLAPFWTEQTIYSERYEYAGTCDWMGTIDHEGERLCVVGDFKTSKALYPESLLQIAAYIHAAIEMGHALPPIAGCLVRLPKVETDPEFQVKIVPAEMMKPLFKVFLNVLELWKWLDTDPMKEPEPIAVNGNGSHQ